MPRSDPPLQHLLARAQADPESVVVSFLVPEKKQLGLHRVTCADLIASTRRLAGALRRAGVRPGARVVVALPTGADFFSAFFASHWCGAVVVPLPSVGMFAGHAGFQQRLSSVVADCAPLVLVADAATRKVAAAMSDAPPLVDPKAGDAAHAEPAHEPGGNEAAILQYTSGSTGDPKGVVITHTNLATNVGCMAEAVELTSEDRVCSWLPLYHDMGLVGGALVPLSADAHAFLMDPTVFALSPASWIRALTVVSATVTLAPNFAYSVAARRLGDDVVADADLSTLRVAFNGAEHVDAETAAAFCERFAPAGLDARCYFAVYGMAESTLGVSFPPVGRGLVTHEVSRRALTDHGTIIDAVDPDDVIRLVGVGRAFPEHQLEIRDPATGAIVEDGVIGEIVIGGGSVSPGYWNLWDHEAELGTSFHTGDLGYVHDGELFIVDRLKDIIITAGYTLIPADVERVVGQVAGVREGRVIACGVPQRELGTEQLVILAEARPTLSRPRQRIRAEVERAVREACGVTPAEVRLLRPRTLQKTSSGKLRRRAARTQLLKGELDGHAAYAGLDPRGWLDPARWR